MNNEKNKKGVTTSEQGNDLNIRDKEKQDAQLRNALGIPDNACDFVIDSASETNKSDSTDNDITDEENPLDVSGAIHHNCDSIIDLLNELEETDDRVNRKKESTINTLQSLQKDFLKLANAYSKSKGNNTKKLSVKKASHNREHTQRNNHHDDNTNMADPDDKRDDKLLTVDKIIRINPAEYVSKFCNLSSYLLLRQIIFYSSDINDKAFIKALDNFIKDLKKFEKSEISSDINKTLKKLTKRKIAINLSLLRSKASEEEILLFLKIIDGDIRHTLTAGKRFRDYFTSKNKILKNSCISTDILTLTRSNTWLSNMIYLYIAVLDTMTYIDDIGRSLCFENRSLSRHKDQKLVKKLIQEKTEFIKHMNTISYSSFKLLKSMIDIYDCMVPNDLDRNGAVVNLSDSDKVEDPCRYTRSAADKIINNFINEKMEDK